MAVKFLTVLAVAATAASVASAESQLEAASGSGSSASIPLCNQTELVELGTILKSNARKLQCEATLNIKDMLNPPDYDFKILCDKVPCTVALTILYNTLPQCRYLDLSYQAQAGTVLKFCGIKPDNTTAETDTGSLGNTPTTTTAPTPAASWGSSGSSGAASFAPVGATSAPVAAATPSPTTSMAVLTASPLTSALVVATSLLATVLFA